MASTERDGWSGAGAESAGATASAVGLDPAAAEMLVQVAHDLRSPLTSILFLIERLRTGQSGPLTPLMAQQLAIVHNATFGLSAVVNDLMELGRGGAHLVQGAPEPYSLAMVLGQVRDVIQPIAEQKGLSIRVSTPREDVHVGHVAAIRRVLLNLATNAVKFTARGGVDLVAEREADQLRFRVTDSGRGIPAEVLATMQAERAEQEGAACFSSAGLGLDICRRLVAEMGGTLEVQSDPRTGTSIVVTLVA